MIFVDMLAYPSVFLDKEPTTEKSTKYREPIPEALCERILKRARYRCELCKEQLGLDLHHKNYDPSDNRESNLIAVCPNCHRRLDVR